MPERYSTVDCGSWNRH